MMHSLYFPAAGALLTVIVAGCSKSSLTEVSGNVTIDGQPLDQGTMQFAPAVGDAPSQATTIEHGKFKTELHRTSYKVQIYAPLTGESPATVDEKTPTSGAITKERLPPRYNIKSELTLHVTGPRGDIKFDLSSRP